MTARPHRDRPAAGDAIVVAERISRAFNGSLAVNDISFEVPRGAILGVVGPSGSGKTTTVRMLTGTLGRSEGEYCDRVALIVDGELAADPDTLAFTGLVEQRREARGTNAEDRTPPEARHA